MNKLNYFITILFITLLTSCGYKVLTLNQLGDYKITEINTSGEKRIGYKLKNQLLFNNNKENGKSIILSLNTKKNKYINEKNIKNEITKYKVEIIVNVTIDNLIEDAKKKTFLISKSGVYDSAKQYSETLKNEKNLINSLSNNLADDILKELITALNDL
jgi:hypothetical protein